MKTKSLVFIATFFLLVNYSLPAKACSNFVYGCMLESERVGDIDIYGRKVIKKWCKCLCKNRKEETRKMRATCNPLRIEERFGD